MLFGQERYRMVCFDISSKIKQQYDEQSLMNDSIELFDTLSIHKSILIALSIKSRRSTCLIKKF